MNDYSSSDAGQEENDGARNFKKILADEANTIIGVKDAILTVMLREGAATWQTVEAHLSAEYIKAQGEFTRFRLEATLAHLHRLSRKPPEPRAAGPDPNQAPPDQSATR